MFSKRENAHTLATRIRRRRRRRKVVFLAFRARVNRDRGHLHKKSPETALLSSRPRPRAAILQGLRRPRVHAYVL